MKSCLLKKSQIFSILAFTLFSTFSFANADIIENSSPLFDMGFRSAGAAPSNGQYGGPSKHNYILTSSAHTKMAQVHCQGETVNKSESSVFFQVLDRTSTLDLSVTPEIQQFVTGSMKISDCHKLMASVVSGQTQIRLVPSKFLDSKGRHQAHIEYIHRK